MVNQGVFDANDFGFGRIVDSPADATEMIVRSLPLSIRARWKRLKKSSSGAFEQVGQRCASRDGAHERFEVFAAQDLAHRPVRLGDLELKV